MDQSFEKLGAFYLGKPFDLTSGQAKDEALVYDSKDLVTHAVCVGMTGSGKTGLCIAMLEEAAIDRVPAIVIDPKGDLSNLLLTFPDLSADEFLPWVNREDAEKRGVTPEQHAEAQAALWRKGLEDSGQGGERIKRLREAADFTIYTPGSHAGIPVAIVRSFPPPPQSVREDAELMAESSSATVTALLGLLKIDADPIRRDHILLSQIIYKAWLKGEELSLEDLVARVQNPPFETIGVMGLEAFYPERERRELSMAINNLLAAPAFSSWMDGAPLDIDAFLYTPEAKPRIAILSIAHLEEEQRMFFVTLLLNRVLSWMYQQSGTTSLRAILYMDEIAGYLPPVANPPSKRPWMTLIKQARAYGLGCVLVTQNPVDLDYKALSNAGTWFIGRLQTQRDKDKVLEGLEVVNRGAAKEFDRDEMDRVLSSLGQRVFLLNNVHEEGPVVFQSRWAMSYLRGPLTREQIRTLMRPRTAATAAAAHPIATAPVQSPAQTPEREGQPRPSLPVEVSEFFIPTETGAPETIVYEPYLLASATLLYADSKRNVRHEDKRTLLVPIRLGAMPVEWEQAVETNLSPDALERTPVEPARYAPLPALALKPNSYEKWRKELVAWCYRNQKLTLMKSSDLISAPGEGEREFRLRVQLRGRETRDREVEELRQKYAPRLEALRGRLGRAEQKVEREAEQAKGQQVQTAISFGATAIGFLFGRKATSSSTLGRAVTAARGVGRSAKERGDVRSAEGGVESVRAKIQELEDDLQSEIAQFTSSDGEPALEAIAITPTKANISVTFLTLAWRPGK